MKPEDALDLLFRRSFGDFDDPVNHEAKRVLEASLKHAARYEWLRSQGTPEHVVDKMLYTLVSDDCHPPYRGLKHGEHLDTAIDAQIAHDKLTAAVQKR